MNELIKRINFPNKKHTNKTNNDFSSQNFKSTKLPIFERLNDILARENKKPYYTKIVLRLFSYICLYLEKIHSDSIYIVNKNNNKYYFSSRLNF